MITLLQGYCMVRSDVQFRCTNLTGKSRTDVLNTPGSQDLRTCVVNLFGAKQVSYSERSPCSQVLVRGGDILTVHYPASLPCTQSQVQRLIPIEGDGPDSGRTAEGFILRGMVSKPLQGHGRSSADRVFLSINKRPCDSSKVGL